jgi:hypothetical protein
VAAPAEGPNGRNGGIAVWGELADAKFKYLLGAFQTNFDRSTPPLFSGRLNLAIIGSEPGYFGNASYFGDKDILAIGVGGQYKKHGSAGGTAAAPLVDDYSEVNGDIVGEFKLGGGAWATGEAAYYHYEGDNNPVKDHFYVMGAIASGPIGIGNIQPMVRYQWAKTKAPPAPVQPDTTTSALDVGLAYLIKGPALRVVATYQHTDLGKNVAGNDIIANSIQLGAQGIFF